MNRRFVDVSGRVASVVSGFSPVILNPKPLQRKVVVLKQPNSKSKSRRWRDCIMQKICCKSQPSIKRSKFKRNQKRIL